MRRSHRFRFGALASIFAVFQTIAFAHSAASDEQAPGSQRALTLVVNELDGQVQLELVAQSATTQKVEYTLELTGANTSRHRGNSTVIAGERQILSTVKTGHAGDWCANVDGTEENGTRYRLSAGDCPGS